MQTPKLSFASAKGILPHASKSSRKPVKVLYGLKPMEDNSVSKLTLGVNKTVKFFKYVMRMAYKTFK